MTPTMSPLTPCGVVVDSRNLHGQARKVFGLGTHGRPGGIKKALNALGLDPVVTYVGIGTRLASQHPSEKARDALAANLRLKEELVAQGAHVLDGMLAERSGALEEKQVDVLCAVKVADLAVRSIIKEVHLGCIVVLSEDMDLMPAYELADTYGVPTYAAAYDSVHRRVDQRNWILLSEEALTDMCEPRGRLCGAALRTHVAEISLGARPTQVANWRVLAPNVRGMALLASNNGSKGLWTPTHRVRTGDRVSLVPVGVCLDPESRRFPYFLLDNVGVQGPFDGVCEAEVLHWVDPTRVQVRLPSGGTANLSASPGTALPGDQVAVLTVESNASQERHLIGVRADRGSSPQWRLSGSFGLIEVTGERKSPGWHLGRCVGTGEQVLIHARELPEVVAGSRIRAAYVGWQDRSQMSLVMPLSTCLPGVTG